MSKATEVIGLANGSLSLSIARQGLHLTRLLVTEVGATQGKTHDILPGPEHFVGKRNFEHCIVGRTCNRLPAKEIKLPGGGTIKPQPFPESNPQASLHGGPDGWDQRDWTLLDPQNATLFTASERKTIASKLPSPQSQMFTLTSPDGDAGYPGEVLAEVLYAVTEGEKEGDGSVLCVYRAKMVGEGGEGKEECPVNLTQHWGFNLDASLGGPSPTKESANVRDHVLTLASSNTLTLDPKTALSTGTLTSSSSSDSPHNHRGGKKIFEKYPKDSPSGGYDDFYLFDDRAELDSPSNPTTFSEDKLTSDSQDFIASLLKSAKPSKEVASLSSAKSPIALSFTTNQQGVQLYTAPGGGSSERKKIHGGSPDSNDTTGYGTEYACFLEFHAPYATYVHPELEKDVGGFNTILKRGQVYNNFARMDVKVSGSA